MPKIILLIQADAAETARVKHALLESRDGPFEVEIVNRLSLGLARLARAGNMHRHRAGSRRIAAVLADLRLPDSNGIATFDALFEAAPEVPILVLADDQGEDTAKLAVKHGAQDYLLKGRLDDYLLPKALFNMIERAANADTLYLEKERAQVTLNSIGDAVMSTDENCAMTYLNTAAETLTGWTLDAAVGRPVDEVFTIIDGDSRKPVPNPVARAMSGNKTVSLAPNCLLISRDGSESAIEDSAAPIHDRRGRVTGAVMVFHDVSRYRAQARKLAHLAQHDSLTDLPNRALFDDRLEQAIVSAQRRRGRLAVLYLDIDRFKHVNDTAGHPAGDLLLQSVARRLLDCVRQSDTVSRHGGDEFVILLGDITHAGDAGVAAEKMLAAITRPHHVAGLEVQVSASIGIATYPMDGQSVEQLYKNADIAMYRAKNCGRDNFQFYKPAMNAHALERLGLEADLRHALERREFELHYQPKVDLHSGAITGCEALLRWRHPTRRLVRPGRFIAIAEDSGLIVPIGRWALREACRQSRSWKDGAVAVPGGVAVNVSAVELRAKNFVAGVGAALADSGLAPDHLELEITETVLMQDEKSTGLVLRQLKDLGVRIALDDFGTGYSSLSHLKRFPIDTLKIDRSFIRHVTTHGEDASIVDAMVRMGRSLHMQVVAEGVETRQQRRFLENQRCPQAQGFYFGKPMFAGAFALRCALGVPALTG